MVVGKSIIERDLVDSQPEPRSLSSFFGRIRPPRVSRRIVIISCLIVFILMATALTSPNHPVAREPSDRGASLENAGIVKNQNAVIKVTIGEPDYLDPAVDYEASGGEIIMNVYETLVWYDGASASNLIPLLATEVPSLTNGGVSIDGLNYTFNLKSGVKFHDNTTMDAIDVEYSFERALRIHDPGGPSWMMEQVMNDYIQYYVGGPLIDFKDQSYGAQWVFDAIGGTADDYIITELDVQNVSEASVLILDSDTVRIRLTHPYPAFLSIAAYTVMSIVSKDFVEANGGVTNAEHNAYMDENTCGTGPYKLFSWEKGSRIHVTRWDSYHGTAPALKDVYVIKANDVNTRILMLQAGDADIAYIPISYEPLFLGNDSFEITKGLPTFTIDFAGFNTEINTTQAATFGSNVPSDFFTDKNIRKAFVHLMDSASFIDDYLDGNGVQMNGPIPMGMLGYNASAPAYEYNVTMAKEYLENATNPLTGNSWWVDGFAVALIYNAGNMLRQTACQYLKTALESLNSFPGIHGTFQATITGLDWPTYLANMRMHPSPLPVFILGWSPDYPDPDGFVNPMLYSYGSYPLLTGYSNATIDSLAVAASMELNITARQEMYYEIVNLCYDDAPYIWLDQQCSFQITRSWLNGYVFNPMYNGDYFAVMSKSNDPPSAVFEIDPPAGPALSDFAFDAGGSSDPNEDVWDLEVRWDWENDSVWDTDWSTEKTATHQYASEGTYDVAMEIRDSVGLKNVTYGTVVVDNAIPEFSSALIPVLFIAVIVASARLIRTKRS